jgi:response regulator RpfG family c-di-GMP phosphodiesterase
MVELAEILCVDDEEQVLEGLVDLLDGRYRVHTASGGAAGLELLKQQPNIAVVMTDMRMPLMNGAAFLQQARLLAPNAIRILLTGYADMQSAMAAVNGGQIFRLLTKPWAPDDLATTFDAAIKQHRLQTAEKVLLQQTLLGCLKSLVDVLALVQPIAFGRAQRLKKMAAAMAREAGLDPAWPIEAAAMLCQLGCIGMSDAVLLKIYDGDPLEEEDERQVAGGWASAYKMLENIPRVEPVLEILAGLSRSVGGAGPIGARVLRIAMDFDSLNAHGYSAAAAIDAMISRAGRYDSELMKVLGRISSRTDSAGSTREVSVNELTTGAVVAEDIRKRNGVLIVPRGIELTANVIAHIHKFGPSLLKSTVTVWSARGGTEAQDEPSEGWYFF